MDHVDSASVYLVFLSAAQAEVAASIDKGPVWVVDSRENRLCENAPRDSYCYDLEFFTQDTSRTLREQLGAQAQAIDAVHKQASYRRLCVAGVTLNEVDFGTFAALGFDQFFDEPGGFSACKSSAPWPHRSRRDDPRFVVILLRERPYFSSGDEDAFHGALKRIPSVEGVWGFDETHGIEVSLRAERVVADDIHELNALLRRYDLAVDGLRKLVDLRPAFKDIVLF